MIYEQESLMEFIKNEDCPAHIKEISALIYASREAANLAEIVLEVVLGVTPFGEDDE